MNIETRARRILSPLSNYRSATDISTPDLAVSRDYGNLIGRYRNSDTDVDSLWFFEQAVVWRTYDSVIEIPFNDIEHIELPSHKESEGLILSMRNGETVLLPVLGKRGLFLDSMEVLRFFDRVLSDLSARS